MDCGEFPHLPGFPVEGGGVAELHAVFLNENRTRRCVLSCVTGNPVPTKSRREIWGTRVRGGARVSKLRSAPHALLHLLWEIPGADGFTHLLQCEQVGGQRLTVGQ